MEFKNSNDSEQRQEKRKAALYVRMSTEHQNYSIENQTAEMMKYAEKHDLEVIETYSDDAKSGLSIKNRKALQKLLRDVQNGVNQYSVLLIYDVSRFGRFQNSDQAAAYEYLCVDAGIEVIYVAENFKNDNSMGSRLEKTLKREMAGGYSKDLSNKVFIGQCRLINYGFRQGGPAGFGLRRMLIDEGRNEKGLLKIGQKKSIQTDRVILVPGPDEEVQIVRWIYKVFVEDNWSERRIAEDLNRRGILTDFERPWTRGTVNQVLTNEKYIGTNVYNRRSFKLKEKRIINPEEEWIKKPEAFEAIVEPRYFYNAQGIIHERNRRWSDEEMIDKLKSLYQRKGWLSGIVIDEADDLPCSQTYSKRFGKLSNAYRLIGYDQLRDDLYIDINRYLRKLYPQIVESAIRHIQELGGLVHREVTSDLIVVNDEITVSIVICRCTQTKAGRNRWKIRLDSGLRPDITIAVRMDEENKEPLDYYLLPALDIENPSLRLMNDNGMALDMYRFDDLEDFFSLTPRSQLPEAA